MSDITRLRPESEVYITRHQLAARLDLGLTKIDELVKAGCPSYTWGLRVRRFRMSEVEHWLRERERSSRMGGKNRPRAVSTAGATATEGYSDAR